MSLGEKGRARAGAARDNALFQKTDREDSPSLVNAAEKENQARKQIVISASLEERLKYYCYINNIKIEASVIREALDKFLPEVPEVMRRK